MKCYERIQTETSEEIIENGEHGGCRVELGGKSSIDGDRRAYGKNCNAEVVELLPKVAPCNWWKRL